MFGSGAAGAPLHRLFSVVQHQLAFLLPLGSPVVDGLGCDLGGSDEMQLAKYSSETCLPEDA